MCLSNILADKNFLNCAKNTEHDIHPFHEFVSVQCSNVNHRHDVSRTHSSCVTETLHFLNSNSSFPPPTAPLLCV